MHLTTSTIHTEQGLACSCLRFVSASSSFRLLANARVAQLQAFEQEHISLSS